MHLGHVRGEGQSSGLEFEDRIVAMHSDS